MEEKIIYLATASKKGIPNVVPIGGKKMLNSKTMLIVDVRLNRTKNNILENPVVGIIAEDLTGPTPVSLQLKGTARLYTQGDYYDMALDLSAQAWKRREEKTRSRKRFPVKSALVVELTDIFDNMRGGARIELATLNNKTQFMEK